MVIFENRVILFSDKSCLYKDTGESQVDWLRWYRRAIARSGDQLRKAERLIKSFPSHLYLDHKCTVKLPITLPDPKVSRIYRIIVAHGAKAACRWYFQGGSGSLRSHIYRAGSAEIRNEWDDPTPFTVSNQMPSGEFVHVLDDISLDIVLKELDTISDFCTYLERKENLPQSHDLIISTGEEELLAAHVNGKNRRKPDQFDFPPNVNGILIPEGLWADTCIDPIYLKKKREDEPSYHVDWLIDYFGGEALNKQLSREVVPFTEVQIALRLIASLNRHERRIVGAILNEGMSNTPATKTRYMGCLVGSKHQLGVGLLHMPLKGLSEKDYHQERNKLLFHYLSATKVRAPRVRQMVGIAIAPRTENPKMFASLTHLDCSNWTKEEMNEARIARKRLGLLSKDTALYRTDRRELTGQRVSSKTVPTQYASGNRRDRRRLATTLRKRIRT